MPFDPWRKTWNYPSPPFWAFLPPSPTYFEFSLPPLVKIPVGTNTSSSLLFLIPPYHINKCHFFCNYTFACLSMMRVKWVINLVTRQHVFWMPIACKIQLWAIICLPSISFHFFRKNTPRLTLLILSFLGSCHLVQSYPRIKRPTFTSSSCNLAWQITVYYPLASVIG
jgi:hypothetical protein